MVDFEHSRSTVGIWVEECTFQCAKLRPGFENELQMHMKRCKFQGEAPLFLYGAVSYFIGCIFQDMTSGMHITDADSHFIACLFRNNMKLLIDSAVLDRMTMRNNVFEGTGL